MTRNTGVICGGARRAARAAGIVPGGRGRTWPPVGAAESDAAVRTYHEDAYFGGVTAASFAFGLSPEMATQATRTVG